MYCPVMCVYIQMYMLCCWSLPCQFVVSVYVPHVLWSCDLISSSLNCSAPYECYPCWTISQHGRGLEALTLWYFMSLNLQDSVNRAIANASACFDGRSYQNGLVLIVSSQNNLAGSG